MPDAVACRKPPFWEGGGLISGGNPGIRALLLYLTRFLHANRYRKSGAGLR
jgi:hypothetical protein